MLPRQTYKTCLTIFMLFALGIVCAQAGVLTVKSNNANYGTVKIGSGTASGTVTSNVSSGQKVTITATAKTGHKFVKWNDNNTTASRQITIANNNNIAYTATFEPLQYTLTVTSSNTNYGTVTGGGTYNYGTSVTLKATPKTGYHFVKWNDNNTNASRSVKVTAAATYTATFAINTYTLTIKTATNNTTQGTVHFAGETAGATATKTVNHGSSVNILATPTGCYRFKQWNDGNTNASRTVTVTAAKAYTATFEQTTYSGTCGTNVKWTFNECTGALSITGTGAMTNYGSGNSPWYSYRASITSVTIANTVTSIGNYAFYHCDNLTSISIGTGVTSIGTEAFWYCGKLPSVTIPSGVTSIGSWAFESCSSLKDIYVSWTTAAAIPTWSSMTTGTASSITLHVPCGSGDIYRAANGWKNYTITGSGTAQYTLTVNASNSALGTVKIDNGTAGATASLSVHCDDIHTITATATLNNDVGCYYFKRWSDNNYENPRKIGISANKAITAEFAEGLGGGTCGTNVTWYLTCDGVLTISGTGMMANYGTSTSMPWYAHRNDIKSVVINPGVTNVGQYAFYNCINLTSVSIPSSVTTIGGSAFYGCSSLPSITIPSSVQTIGQYAFRNCTSLTSVTIPSGVTSIGSYAFYNTGLTDIYVSWATAGAIPNWSSMTQNYDIFLHVPCGTAEYYMAKAGWKEYNIRGGCNTTYTLTVASNNSAFGLVQIDDNTPAASITEQVYTDDSHRITAVPVDACHQFVQWEDGSTENPRNVMPNTNTTYTATFAEERYSGTCGYNGNNLTWVFECDSTLRISGTGMMKDYSSNNQPWQSISTLIKHVVIEEGVTTIGDNAFYAMKNIVTVTNPSTLQLIGSVAFHSCYGLESINFPDGLTFLGRNTTGHGPFYGCHSLKSIHIPASVTFIAKDAFLRCYSATSIVVDPANTVYDSRDNCNAIIETAINKLWYGCQTTVIPDGVLTVAPYAFEYQHNLKSIRISNTVTSFGTTVFKECENLKDIYVEWTTTPPANILTTWYEHANLDATITIHVPCGKKSIYTSSSVWNRYQIVDDHLKGGMCGAQGSNQTWMLSCDGALEIKGIGEMADYTAGGAPWYAHKDAIHTITFAEGITSIGENAFADFTNLTDIYAPWTENIPVLPASNNPQPSVKLHIPCSVISAYQAAGWGNYTVETEYTASGTCGADGDNLTWTLCEGVLTISGTGAMANYPALNMPWKYFITSITSVIISDGVTTIGSHAFNGCSHLTSLTVPPSLTSIGQNAFSGCWAMESLYISDLTAWCNISFGTYDSSPFCRNGYLIYVGGGDLYVNGTKVTTLTIPDGVTEIKHHAFYGCACITDIQFNQVTSIGNEAFNGCHGLTEVTIPEGVTAIGNYGFAYCTHLQSISIPASASSLGTSMLAADNALKDIYVHWTENIPVWPENFTKKSPQSSITLHVPCGAMNLYQTANGWKDYTLEAESGPYTITVTAEEGGSVDGGGSFNCGASVTLTATPDDNYRFIQWSDGDTHNPRSVTVNGNATYTAQFGIAQYTITVNAETGGTATGSGTYNTDQVINLTATPDDCYMFKQWTDGDTHNPRMVSVNGEVTYTAQFEKLQFTVTASPDDETKGDVNIEKVE
ncbi:MAG: leucine-rich repeat protein [Bacteroidales bacterium]|nr:leucine-rich repeat protein [Bacteroidales bacterium]